jgi:hypothetical protein
MDCLVFLIFLYKIAFPRIQSVENLPENGGVAQLGEHFHGMEGVVGSIPIASTIFRHPFNKPGSPMMLAGFFVDPIGD